MVTTSVHGSHEAFGQPQLAAACLQSKMQQPDWEVGHQCAEKGCAKTYAEEVNPRISYACERMHMHIRMLRCRLSLCCSRSCCSWCGRWSLLPASGCCWSCCCSAATLPHSPACCVRPRLHIPGCTAGQQCHWCQRHIAPPSPLALATRRQARMTSTFQLQGGCSSSSLVRACGHADPSQRSMAAIS